MRPIRFEEADSPERTQIGEGLTRVAVAAGRLETGREGGKYFLRHDDGCGVCGRAIAAGDAFYLDPDAGEILCADHGRERREATDAEDGDTADDDTAQEADDGTADDDTAQEADDGTADDAPDAGPDA